MKEPERGREGGSDDDDDGGGGNRERERRRGCEGIERESVRA